MSEHSAEKDAARGWTHEEAKRHTLIERLHERCAIYGGASCPEKSALAREDWCERCLAAEALTRILPPAVCPDCGHQHTPNGCTGDPTPSDLWAGVSPAVCDCPTRDLPPGGFSGVSDETAHTPDPETIRDLSPGE